MGSPAATSNPRVGVEAGIERLRRSPLAIFLVAVVCGIGLTASAVTLVRAADDAGILDMIRSDALTRMARAVQLPGRQPRVRNAALRRRVAMRDVRARNPRRTRVADARAAAAPMSRRTVCVRVCDGYVFPLGTLRGRGDLAAHRSACESACPGAETSLYMLMPGQTLEEPGNARSVQDGSFYRRLKTAFLFRQQRVSACSCQGPDNLARATPILLDPTLRTGDVVVDQEGTAKVFAGGSGVPHSPRAFTEYRRSRVLTRTAQADLDRLMGTSQRAAVARDYARRVAVRQAGLAEIAPPAGSAANVRVYRMVSGAGTLDPSGARIFVVR